MIARRRFLQLCLASLLLPGCPMSWDEDGDESPGEQALDPPLLSEARQQAEILEQVIPRSQWRARSGRPGRMRSMGPIHRLTLHHEGGRACRTATGRAENASLMRSIQAYHLRKGWSDIGYHFVIDPAGRIWEGRPLQFQGSHVRRFNPHNVAVMVLGNFDRQRPSERQLEVMEPLLRGLRRLYQISDHQLRSHRQWAPTRCPGRYLQAAFESMKRVGALT